MRRWLCVVLVGLATASCANGPLPPPITQVGTVPPTSEATTTTVALSTTGTPLPSSQADRAEERLAMVEEQIEPRSIGDPLVLEAMKAAPRHRFVSDHWQDYAYRDHPLPIGHGQTISQPYIVALMTEALHVEPGDKVLEIGTGSGYQAAVLAEMDLDVYTIEIIPELAGAAETALRDLGYEVMTRAADGYFGWPEEAPFDAIIVTAAPDHVPQPLVDQLAPGGVMVVPVGPIGAVQTLWSFTLEAGGELGAESLGWVSFVPFTRAAD